MPWSMRDARACVLHPSAKQCVCVCARARAECGGGGGTGGRRDAAQVDGDRSRHAVLPQGCLAPVRLARKALPPPHQRHRHAPPIIRLPPPATHPRSRSRARPLARSLALWMHGGHAQHGAAAAGTASHACFRCASSVQCKDAHAEGMAGSTCISSDDALAVAKFIRCHLSSNRVGALLQVSMPYPAVERHARDGRSLVAFPARHCVSFPLTRCARDHTRASQGSESGPALNGSQEDENPNAELLSALKLTVPSSARVSLATQVFPLSLPPSCPPSLPLSLCPSPLSRPSSLPPFLSCLPLLLCSNAIALRSCLTPQGSLRS